MIKHLSCGRPSMPLSRLRNHTGRAEPAQPRQRSAVCNRRSARALAHSAATSCQLDREGPVSSENLLQYSHGITTARSP